MNRGQIGVALGVGVLLAGCGAPTPVSAPQPVSRTSALSVLGTLRVAGRGPKTGYTRAEFGQAWADVDRNGCDTRNDILQRCPVNK
ncbi:unannotated protein [freshwater metagenome]|uniref:Unannotated protein n=1 Tax=freshwater metagenome TaxID=449393 RepID=A0A6J6VTT4_9ZZZZ